MYCFTYFYIAQNALKKKSKFNDQRLSKQEFRELIELLVKEMSGPENFELLVEFLMNSVEVGNEFEI